MDISSNSEREREERKETSVTGRRKFLPFKLSLFLDILNFIYQFLV